MGETGRGAEELVGPERERRPIGEVGGVWEATEQESDKDSMAL